MSVVTFLILALLAIPIEEDITALLPPDGVPPEWSRDSGPQLFEGEALYSHINGGAELYLRHGFVQLAVQDYGKGGLQVRVEIFDMGRRSGAEALFMENTRNLEISSDLGEGASVDPLQIIFYRGRYYVSVSCYDESEESQQAMAALAITVDDNLQ